MKLVLLDKKTIGEDIDFSGIYALGDVTEYDFTQPEEIPERVADADVLIVNKVPVNEQTIYSASHLKLVCVTATGTNNLDKNYLEQRGIAWRNVAGYSTESVAQHTFSMLFYLLEHLRYYDDYVKERHYLNDTMFTHFARHFRQISGMTWGIIGLGAIGRKVADLAQAFGAKVLYYSASGREPQAGYTQVDFDTLLSQSDIVSIHAPLNEYTENLLDDAAFQKMKSSAILLNLGRGPIINEAALVNALKEKQIAAAGLDVLCEEPMRAHCPLLEILDFDNVLITPHIGWASIEARTTLMQIITKQIQDFFNN